MNFLVFIECMDGMSRIFPTKMPQIYTKFFDHNETRKMIIYKINIDCFALLRRICGLFSCFYEGQIENTFWKADTYDEEDSLVDKLDEFPSTHLNIEKMEKFLNEIDVEFQDVTSKDIRGSEDNEKTIKQEDMIAYGIRADFYRRVLEKTSA